jgi:hypothetical protein
VNEIFLWNHSFIATD